MNGAERREQGIASLPGNLLEALNALESDEVIAGALGDHALSYFLQAKRREWRDYIATVSQWEIDRYLTLY